MSFKIAFNWGWTGWNVQEFWHFLWLDSISWWNAAVCIPGLHNTHTVDDRRLPKEPHQGKQRFHLKQSLLMKQHQLESSQRSVATTAADVSGVNNDSVVFHPKNRSRIYDNNRITVDKTSDLEKWKLYLLTMLHTETANGILCNEPDTILLLHLTYCSSLHLISTRCKMSNCDGHNM